MKFLKNEISLKAILISGLNISLVLFILNLLSLNLGIFEPSYILIFNVYLLLGILLLNIPLKKLFYLLIRRKTPKKAKAFVGVILIIFCFIILLTSKDQMLWIASIPILLAGLDITLQSIEIQRKELYLLSVASFTYAIFFILLQTIPTIWNAIHQFSLIVTNFIGTIINRPLSLGPSISGLWILTVFLIFSIVSFFLSSDKKQSSILRFTFTIVGLFIAWIIYLVIFGFVSFESENVGYLHLILFLLCLTPTYLYLLKYEFKTTIDRIKGIKGMKAKKLLRLGGLLAVLFLFISSVILTIFLNIDSVETDERKILFYGQKMLGTWDIPEYGKYGREAAGMFGLLPIYTSLSGYETEIAVENTTAFLNSTQPVQENITRYVNVTDFVSIIQSPEITRDILSDVDVLVVININKSFSPKEKEIIWRFVENGGSLLVLGDHTNVGGIQEPLNDLLQPVDIHYRFDSALPLDPTFKWMTCYQLLHHPITFNIRSLDEIQISVGASLSISHPSFPILLGRYALSDLGDPLNEEFAYLGDYLYNPSEQLGDIILAAGSYYGEGKVVVFGDTSTFQNAAIPYSYPFIQNIFTWLNSERTGGRELLQIVVSLVLLLAAFLTYLIVKSHNISFTFFPVILCFALLFSSFVNANLAPEVKMMDNAVYIDASHGERFNLEPFTDESINGVIFNLNRNRFFPVISRDFSKEQFIQGKILFFIAPTKSFTRGEIDFLKEYMFDGGFIVIATGYEDKEASMPLLEEFDLEIEKIPLGPVPYVEEDPEAYEKEPKFVDGWPILFNKQKGTSFYSYNFTWDTETVSDYHLMVFVEQGKGGLLLISDSQYLLDKNIESIYDYWPGNIIFLKHILDEFEAMEA